MNLPAQIAKHFRDVHFGGNWTSVNLRETLQDINWQQAATQVHSFNTIAALVFHINYYVSAVLKVMEGGPLTASDKFSFDHPPVRSQQDWENMLEKTWADAEKFAALVEKLPPEMPDNTFCDEKYGSYYRNLHGIIEHTHYHLGQIVLIKKLLQENEKITPKI